MTGRHDARLLYFGALYFAQGAILSYFLTFNILYLREHGFEAAEVGFFQAVLVLPFVLKLLLGLLSDRFSLFGLGHRYPYILLGLTIQVAALLVLPAIDLPEGLVAYFLVALLAATGMALYDTCTDGLAVESTAVAERGVVQGVMVGSRAVGILLALLLGGFLAGTAGWTPVFVMVLLMTLPAIVLTLRFWGRGDRASESVFDWSVFRRLLGSSALRLALLGCLYALAMDGVLAYLSYHGDAGELGEIGLLSGLVALSMVGRIAGAATAAMFSERLGYRRSLLATLLLSALAAAALSLHWGVVVLSLACLVFGIAYGLFTTVYAAAAMRLSDTRVAASMFAVFMLCLNVGIALGQALAGSLTGHFGFPVTALLMAGLLLALLLPANRLGRADA